MPVMEELEEVEAEIRPRLRGTLHRITAPIAAVAFIPLVVMAETTGDAIAVLVYGFCVTAMLTVSGTYHRARLSDRARRVLKRIDHSTILLAIAGSYTAITVLALDGAAEVTMLVVAWTAATVGILIRMFWLDAPPPLVAAVYVISGWLLVFDIPAYLDGLSNGEFALIAVGGLLYTAGAVVYARKAPNPWPATFGYHEIFHAFVVVAAACHYLAVLSLVRS